MLQEPCPRCGSSHTAVKQTARQSGAVIGLTAGAASGASGAVYGSRIGGAIGLIGGPSVGALGTVAGAILGALAGGTAGCIAGITVGQVVDDNVIGNRRCKHCDHVFTAPSDTHARAHAPLPQDNRQRALFDAHADSYDNE